MTSISPENILSALIQINHLLSGEDHHDLCLRTVNFMGYELNTITSPQNSMVENLKTLNNFFFNTKTFRVQPKPVLLKKVLNERCGSGMLLSLLFAHLAKGLGIQAQIVHWPAHTILKIELDGKSRFINLNKGGEFLSDEELLDIVNKNKEPLRTLETHEALHQYLMYLAMHFKNENDKDSLLLTLGAILQLDAENTRFVAERALLRFEKGMYKDALCDFKRYFSFTEIENTAPEILMAFEKTKRQLAEVNELN
jgi:regulator of sirC expression with transglutaminase-like and TPR domain